MTSTWTAFPSLARRPQGRFPSENDACPPLLLFVHGGLLPQLGPLDLVNAELLAGGLLAWALAGLPCLRGDGGGGLHGVPVLDVSDVDEGSVGLRDRDAARTYTSWSRPPLSENNGSGQ